MVQHTEDTEDEEKPITNGDFVKSEEDCETNEEKEQLNGHVSECEESDDDDYLDHLLMLPPLDGDLSNRNKYLVSRSLLDFCTAIESRKEYQKIKQELLSSSSQQFIENEKPDLAEEPPNLTLKEKTPPLETKCIEVTHEDAQEVPETRRHSIRLKRAMFVPEHEPSPNDQFFVCRRCTIFFRTRKLRKEHNLMHHRRKTIPTGIEKQKHRLRRSSSNKDPFICDLCQKQFKQKSLLRSHMNSHQLEPQFFCSLCPYASKRSSDLKKHHETHHNPDRIGKVTTIRKRKCEKCDQILNGKKALKLHMKEKHPQESPVKKIRLVKRQCEKCEEVLQGMKAYRLHIKHNHAEAIVIRCETCHRKFKTNFRLKKHQNKYNSGNDCRNYFRQNGEKTSFDCQQCDKKFLLKSHLVLHMRKHTNLTCEKCSATFKNKLNLKWHEFSHLEIEPKCSNCAVNFTSEQKFAVHLKKKICMTNGVAKGTAE